MKNALSNFIRVLLAFLIVASASMCFFWLPQAVSYVSSFLQADIAEAETVIYSLCAVVAAPVFAIFGISFAFPRAIEKETLFSMGIAKLLKAIGAALIGDCIFFCAILLLLLSAGEIILAPALLFVGALGITVGSMLLVLSEYVKRAATLKEEADCTL